MMMMMMMMMSRRRRRRRDDVDTHRRPRFCIYMQRLFCAENLIKAPHKTRRFLLRVKKE